MTDQDDRRSRTRGAASERRAYGVTPVLASGLLSAGLVALLAVGSVSAAGALSAPPKAPSKHAATRAVEAPPNTLAGADAPVADPSFPPDRDSDRTRETPPADTIYRIRTGDTLTSISRNLGVSVDAIAEYNAVRNLDVISEGAVLRLPYIYVPPTESAD